jgi:hypothetical protein
MNIIIHGTKGGGGRIFYKTDNAPASWVGDLRRNCEEDTLGNTLYSIEFPSNGCVFTKYVIVRDIRRNREVGYVAFSVYCKNSERMTGNDMKTLLDELLKHYYDNYIVGNNLNANNEDWTFVDVLANSYESHLQPVSAYNFGNIQQGTADAAFIYYSSDEELQKYFDDPYQKEYSVYEQIFFVKNDLQDKPQNPLNALRHNPASNLTKQIELENMNFKSSYNPAVTDPSPDTVITIETKRHNIDQEINITGAKIFYESDDGQKKEVIKNKITFRGEERNKNWTVWAEKVLLRSRPFRFIPGEDSKCISVILEEYRNVTFQVTADGYAVDNYIIQLADKNGNIICNSDRGFLEFYGDDIHSTWDITITLDKYKDETFPYCPSIDKKLKYVTLTFDRKKRWKKDRNGKKLRFHKILEWLFMWALGLSGFAVFAFTVIVFIKSFSSERNKVRMDYSYVEGIEFTMDSLGKLRDAYCPVKHRKSKKMATDLTMYCKKIDTAFAIRTAIKEGDIDFLKSRSYSGCQEKFKEAVDSIDNMFKVKIGKTMNADTDTVSRMNLNQVAKYITSLQKLLKIREEVKNMSNNKKLKNKKEEFDTIAVCGFHIDSIKKNIKKEIENKEKSNNLAIAANASAASGKGKISISEFLETEFWKLVESGNINKESYDSLTVKYSRISAKDKYKVFCYLYMSKSYDINCNDKEKADGMRGFKDGFAKIEEIHRKSIKDLKLLQSFIRGDTINVLEKYIEKMP